MKHTKVFLLFILLLAGTTSAIGKTWVVGKPNTSCPHAQFTTIGAAIEAAAAGDQIEVCPAAYPEQLIINKPLTLTGIQVNGSDRILLQPTLTDLEDLATEAVITVMNTSDVTIRNLAIDASKNSVSSCSPGVAAVHFFNASGSVTDSVVFNAHLTNPLSCTSLPFGNGFGVRVDSDGTGAHKVEISRNSIHDYTANGIQVNGAGLTADICGNKITGIGPAGGIFQFAIFIVNGAVAKIENNSITEGVCGPLATVDCISTRSEGITLRAIGDGTVVRDNVIMNAQSGIFINGANDLKVSQNRIGNIYGLDGIDIQATASGYFTNSIIEGNEITVMGGVTDPNAGACGIYEYSGTGTVSGNEISNNNVNDAFCGVGYTPPDKVVEGHYSNVLYTELNSSLPTPAAIEP